VLAAKASMKSLPTPVFLFMTIYSLGVIPCSCLLPGIHGCR
jgi:hypothetical protein